MGKKKDTVQLELQLLQRLLADEKTSETEILEIAQSHTEGLYLDFKSGKQLQNREKWKACLREYASAFANTGGGTLVFGVDDETRNLVPCPETQKPWAEVAGDVLRQMSPDLVPAPRISEIIIEPGSIVIVAFAEAPLPVAAPTERGRVYYLRCHDGNFPLEGPALAKWLTGRARRPILDILFSGASEDMVRWESDHNDPYVTFKPIFWAENVGFVTADDVQMGMVSWALDRSEQGYALPARDVLLQHVDAEPCSRLLNQATWQLHASGFWTQKKGQGVHLRPFLNHAFSSQHAFPVLLEYGVTYRICVAVYLQAEGHLPSWYEVTFNCGRRDGWTPPRLLDVPQSRRMNGERPRVYMKPIDQAGRPFDS